MRVVLVGAFGHLGYEILKRLIANGHEVIAAGRSEVVNDELKDKYIFKKVDALQKESFVGLCKDADVVITTMGLTTSSKEVDNYDIDYKGNMYLYKDACRCGVKKFNFVSVIACDEYGADDVPMLNAKFRLEEVLKKGKMDYVIYRPTGYFYDILRVFKPFIDKGHATLLRGYHGVKANVVSCPDLAEFIVEHMTDSNKTYDIGGKETYTYEQMINMCFRAAGKKPVIKDAPKWLFTVLANLPKTKKAGKRDVMLFSKWTLTHDLVGDTVIGNSSFKEYVKEYFSHN